MPTRRPAHHPFGGGDLHVEKAATDARAGRPSILFSETAFANIRLYRSRYLIFKLPVYSNTVLPPQPQRLISIALSIGEGARWHDLQSMPSIVGSRRRQKTGGQFDALSWTLCVLAT
jgi:hypothetical protein